MLKVWKMVQTTRDDRQRQEPLPSGGEKSSDDQQARMISRKECGALCFDVPVERVEQRSGEVISTTVMINVPYQAMLGDAIRYQT